MPDEECLARRSSDWPILDQRVTSMEHKVTSLEAWRTEQRQEHAHHDIILDKLLEQDADMVKAIELIAQSFLDFKNLFKVGFQIISICTLVVVGIVGAFWSYSHDLDEKYAPKFDRLVNNTEAQKQTSFSNSAKLNEVHNENEEQSQTLQDQIDTLTRLKTDIVKMQKLKVIKGSR